MRRIVVGIASILTVLTLTASAYAEVLYDAASRKLTISGESTIFQAQAAVSILETQEVRVVYLSGPGGDARVVPFLGDRILAEDVTVVIPFDTVCASACAYVATAGSKLVVQGELWFHRAFYPRVPGNASLDEIGGRYSYSHLNLMKWWVKTGFTFDHLIPMTLSTDLCSYVILSSTEEYEVWKADAATTNTMIINTCEE